MTSFWHPFADMAAVAASGELVIDRGEGVHVWDEAGRRYLDATAGLWFCNAGYGRQAIADAAAAQLARMPAYSCFGDYANRPVLDLAERVAALAPVPGTVSFFTSGGSDAVDTAVKLVRRYWQEVGHPERSLIAVRRNAYHGMHVAGTSLSGIAANRQGYGELLETVVQVPWDSADDLAAALDEAGPERVAAFFCEPVLGAGGLYPPPDGYLQAARQVCRERGVLFVADEVITGFGRTGAWFASGRFGLEPDLLLCAKGITSGYLPMGAVLAAPQIAEPFWSEPGTVMWRHGYTYSGHAAVAAAALANIDILEAEGLPARALALEEPLGKILAPLTASPLVSEIRSGTGLLAAVQLAPDQVAADPALPQRAIAALRAEGVLTRAIGAGALQVSPALTVTEDDLRSLAEAAGRALDRLERERPAS